MAEIFTLLLEMIKSMCVVTVLAYIFSQTKVFKNILFRQSQRYEKYTLIFFFSFVSIIGTYMNIPINGAYANTRPIGAIVAGLIFGPYYGMIVGSIAGLHRFFMGGFTGLACGLATVIEGLTGGIFYYIRINFKKKLSYNKKDLFLIGIASGIVAEILQMLTIIIIAKPYDMALNTVEKIAIPMIIANSLGVSIFTNIITNTREEYERVGAIYSQKVLNIANMISPYLRKGLNNTSAEIAASIIYEKFNCDAVCITDNNSILGYEGYGKEHYNNHNINSSYINKVLEEQKYKIVKTKDLISCSKNGCMLNLAIIVPLNFNKDKSGGLLVFYYCKNKKIENYDVDFANSIAQLMSTQLELARLEKQAQMSAVIELKMLQAQIHPHFLFNALNTISSFCRTNPTKARELIINLSNFFRKTLNRDINFVSIKEEIELVDSYLNIEIARFGKRLNVAYDISSNILDFKIPTFIIQPIVENSIKHGISICPNGGSLKIIINDMEKYIYICVIDTGIGMSSEKLNYVIKNWPGIGLKNVNERLKNIYGNKYGLEIESEINKGTKVSFEIPK